MRQPSPTLIDTLYRASFSKDCKPGWTSNQAWRSALTSARRFVLNDDMSTFLGDLSLQAFTKPGLSAPVMSRIADTLRTSARLPHATTWIEYNLRKNQARTSELLHRPFNPLEIPMREGWLLQQHPKIDTAFIAHIVTRGHEIKDDNGNDVWIFPIAIAWTVDQDTIIPWRAVPFDRERSAAPSEVATGLTGYNSDRAGFVFSDLIATPHKSKANAQAIAKLLREWSGVLRRIWTLLATINDLPVTVSEAAVSKGFVARGQYRKFLSHKTITLNVPEKLYRKTIRNALSLAHRRAHSVRGHWRRDWHKPLSPLCDHEWTADDKHMTCARCFGRKSWITEHERGDASRGFVTHDYVVTHETEKTP